MVALSSALPSIPIDPALPAGHPPVRSSENDRCSVSGLNQHKTVPEVPNSLVPPISKPSTSTGQPAPVSRGSSNISSAPRSPGECHNETRITYHASAALPPKHRPSVPQPDSLLVPRPNPLASQTHNKHAARLPASKTSSIPPSQLQKPPAPSHPLNTPASVPPNPAARPLNAPPSVTPNPASRFLNTPTSVPPKPVLQPPIAFASRPSNPASQNTVAGPPNGHADFVPVETTRNITQKKDVLTKTAISSSVAAGKARLANLVQNPSQPTNSNRQEMANTVSGQQVPNPTSTHPVDTSTSAPMISRVPKAITDRIVQLERRANEQEQLLKDVQRVMNDQRRIIGVLQAENAQLERSHQVAYQHLQAQDKDLENAQERVDQLADSVTRVFQLLTSYLTTKQSGEQWIDPGGKDVTEGEQTGKKEKARKRNNQFYVSGLVPRKLLKTHV